MQTSDANSRLTDSILCKIIDINESEYCLVSKGFETAR
jgi:hypothetical protein